MPENSQSETLKQDLSGRIRRLRLEKKWSQAELAQKLSIQQKQISAYERGANNPSTEILIKLAAVFDVSLDYLAFDAEGQSTKVQVKDRELLRYFETIDNFNEHEKRIVKEILSLVVKNHNIKEELAM